MISPVDQSIAAWGVPGSTESERKELGQEAFLKLMMTQLRNQDPFKPMESGEFLGQLAQFGTVAGLAELKGSFADLASSLVSSQALQGAALVGRSVLVEAKEIRIGSEGGVDGAVDLPMTSSTVRVRIENQYGETVRELDLGSGSRGLARFHWSGDTGTGDRAAPGTYRVVAEYFNGAEMQRAPVLVDATVDSVIASANGLSVNVAGIGVLPFASIREIG